MEPTVRVQYWLTIFSFVVLCFLGYMLNHIVSDLRALKAQVAENRSEILASRSELLKLHVDILQTAANGQNARKASAAEPGAGR